MQEKVDTIEKVDVQLPKKYNVIFLNDDITPMGFVVEILMSIFDMEKNKAISVMLKIHNEDKAIVGTYIKSIAESKVTLVRNVAMKANYPLQALMEQE